jgi:hypothetical protein
MWPALLLAYYQLIVISDSTLSEDFNDLGKLMLAGFVAAVGVALAFTFIRFRLREKKANNSQFISISAPRDEE